MQAVEVLKDNVTYPFGLGKACVFTVSFLKAKKQS